MDSRKILRGEIWLVNLDPTIGAEIKKTRPAVIISNNINNEYAGTVTILPLSDQGEKVYPFEVAISSKDTGLIKPSKVKCQQIRTVDKSRAVKLLGTVSKEEVASIDQAVLIHLGISV